MQYALTTVTITKGFKVWKEMADNAKKEMDDISMKILIAATDVNDETKLYAIIEYADLEAVKEFMSRADVEEIRKNAGVLTETTTMTLLNEPRLDFD